MRLGARRARDCRPTTAPSATWAPVKKTSPMVVALERTEPTARAGHLNWRQLSRWLRSDQISSADLLASDHLQSVSSARGRRRCLIQFARPSQSAETAPQISRRRARRNKSISSRSRATRPLARARHAANLRRGYKNGAHKLGAGANKARASYESSSCRHSIELANSPT